jgi:hypothetical protein
MKKRICLLIILFSSVLSANAQNWGGGIDDNDLHFGFTFQYLSSDYKIIKNENWRNTFNSFVPETPPRPDDPPYSGRSPSLDAIYSKSNPGYGIGFVVNYKLAEHSDLRFTPTLVFSDRLLYYQFSNKAVSGFQDNLKEQKVQSTMIDFPLGYKLKSDRRGNFRAYLLGGAKYSMDITSSKKSDNTGLAPLEKFVKNKKNFLSYEAGIGFDLYFEYFKMSPEIKVSNSIGNILKQEDNQPYARSIDKLMLRHVTFSLFFE